MQQNDVLFTESGAGHYIGFHYSEVANMYGIRALSLRVLPSEGTPDYIRMPYFLNLRLPLLPRMLSCILQSSNMNVCGILVSSIIDVKQIWPHDPCSIAGITSLYADSDLTDREAFVQGGR